VSSSFVVAPSWAAGAAAPVVPESSVDPMCCALGLALVPLEPAAATGMVRGFERVVLVVSTIAVALWLLVFVIVAAVVRVLGAWLADRVA
jgi:hypothetical protein